MKAKIQFRLDKAIAAIKLVLSNMDAHSCDFHKLFKILYFAEQNHLVEYGKPIIGDMFIAMKDGPVPSNVYDVLKVLKGSSIFVPHQDFKKDFDVRDGYFIYLKNHNVEDEFDILSEAEIETLSKSIAENKNLSFKILRDKSHDEAWHAANQDETMNIFDIAKAGGADDELLQYISVAAENRTVGLK